MATKEIKHPTEANDFHLNQLAAVGQIAAGIAHEVKNPLTAVKGFLQLLKEEHNEGYLNIAQAELNNALSTIEGLLHVSKPDLDDEPHQLIKPAAELEGLFTLFQDQLYRVSIQRNFRDVNAMVYGKKNQIKKALFNLLKNAFEAIPEKGTITVEHYVEEENVVISIEDTGIGIPKDKLRMLGTPFYTTKAEGTGMGLTQVFSVFKGHNAIVNVESSENQGTKFIIKIHMDNPNKIIGVNVLDLEYLEGYDFTVFLKENKPKFEHRLLHEAVTVKDKIDDILRVGNIDLLSNAYKLVLYVVEGREHEMISFAKQEGIAWAKYSLTLAFKLEWIQTVRRVLWDFLYNFDRLNGTAIDREEFYKLEKKINNLVDQFLNHFFVSYSDYKDRLIQSQRELVEDLFVPIIPVTPSVCILPLIGKMDEYRMETLEDKVLSHIGSSRIDTLIIDLSGVLHMELPILKHITNLINGMSMMGCKTVVTGLRPEIVKQIIRSGLSFEERVIAKATLEQALDDFLIRK